MTKNQIPACMQNIKQQISGCDTRLSANNKNMRLNPST